METLETDRRDFGAVWLGGMLAALAGASVPSTALAQGSSGKLPASILELLGDLDQAVAELASTWKPDDPAYRADLYRQIMMSLSYSYFAFFHADAEHPDWAPLWNPVYTLQPNPDDIYLHCPIRGDLTYRVSGNRGTCHILSFTTTRGSAGMIDADTPVTDHNDLDHNDLEIGPDGDFEVIFSAERPAGHAGNWAKISPEANAMMVRYRSYDWAKERDPQLSIECLDQVPPKRRLTPDDIAARIRQMALFPVRASRRFLAMQNGIKERVGVNVVEPVRLKGALSKQVYWPAVFELDDGEALIIETELPKVRPYWNIQINDPYFNAVEYVYRLSSINGATARVSSDGKLRAVIALEDPGVPNWLDTAGFKQGTFYGRWYDADSEPVATVKRVKLAELRSHLPKDTPTVTPEQRAEELRRRVVAAQRRRRW